MLHRVISKDYFTSCTVKSLLCRRIEKPLFLTNLQKAIVGLFKWILNSDSLSKND